MEIAADESTRERDHTRDHRSTSSSRTSRSSAALSRFIAAYIAPVIDRRRGTSPKVTISGIGFQEDASCRSVSVWEVKAFRTFDERGYKQRFIVDMNASPAHAMC